MIIKHHYKQKNIEPPKGLADDMLTFSILSGMLKHGSSHVITDHDTYCIAFSATVYPVWIWVANNINEAQLQEIWQLSKAHYPLMQNYRYNVTYKVAKWIIDYEKTQGNKIEYLENLLCYECKETIMPKRANHLEMVHARHAEAERIGQYIYDLKQEALFDVQSLEECQKTAEAYIENKQFYLLKDAEGQILTMCSAVMDEQLAKIGHVYTPKPLRRNGYAQRLVYLVTEKILKHDLRPILYTDADYGASNACYKQIGFQEVGALCTIGLKK